MSLSFLFVDTVGFATGCGKHVCCGAEEHAVVAMADGRVGNQPKLITKQGAEGAREGQTECKERPKDSSQHLNLMGLSHFNNAY